MKALIIDDEKDICYLLSNILKQKNVDTIFASNLTEAEQILEQEKTLPIIFLDNHLPDGLGIAYVRKLKKAYPNTKIIMITAHDNASDREIAKAEGVDDFIGKPFLKTNVLSTLESLRK
jgi:two-component system OmpR family response regulator